MDLGAFRFLNAQEVFPTEPSHFSKWVAGNFDRLGAALELDLELVELEAEVGPFSLDILARIVGTQDLVIIENQIEQTDHSHLGQLLTYAAGYDAKYIVWISPEFRENHRAALDWLNANTTAARNFFGIRVEVLRIDDSRPAVNFRTVALPNEWQKAASQVARSASTSADQEQLNEVFQAIHHLAQQSGVFARLLNPRTDSAFYVLERTHQGAVEYSAAFGWDKLRPEVILNHVQPAVNARLFELLRARAQVIQEAVRDEITWDFQERRRRQALRVVRTIDRPNIANSVDELAVWTTERLVELRRAVEPGLDAEIAQAIAMVQAAVGQDNAEATRV